jgi:REP element-mobilizing transposase RayT
VSDKFQDKYRIPSARWKDWDYGWNGAYFITICTAGRDCVFGKIVNGKMALSDLGILADKFWYEITNHFPFAELGEFVVMPNHVHGIIVMNKLDDGRWTDEYGHGRDAIYRVSDDDAEMPWDETIHPITDENLGKSRRDAIYRISDDNPEMPKRDAINRVSTAKLGGITGNKNPMIIDNLSKIVRWYKGRVSFESRKIHPNFDWQSRFHDHIIRNDGAYQRIAEYIQNNPANWQADQFYME